MSAQTNGRLAAGFFFVALVTACRDGAERRITAPFALHAALMHPVDCSGACVLADGVAVLRAAGFQPDSDGAVLSIATETIVGAAGDSVIVLATVDSGVAHAAGAAERLLVQVGNHVSTFSIADAASGIVVYRFSSSDSIHVSYGLSKDVRSAIPDGQFRLTQTANSASVQMSYQQPLAKGGGTKPPPCSITQQSATVCKTVVTLSPFFAPSDIGGTFTSQSGSAASDTITVNFSVPVESLTVTIWDPTFAGNKMVAYDAQGSELASADFRYSGAPGINHPDTEVVAATGIRRVELIPAPGDYVAYEAHLTIQGPKLVVTASADSASAGDTLTYTASNILGGAITVTGWQWVQDAGTSPPPGFVELLPVSSCSSSSLTCKHTPGTSGTIKVLGKLAHNKADSASLHITVAQPHISVVCTPGSVVRASDTPVSCTAQASGTLAVTGWTFTATDTATGTVVRSTDTTSTQWSGVVVASGAVIVRGMVDGVAAVSDTGRITVTPRTTGWSWRGQISTADASPGTLECFATPLYDTTSTLGWTVADSTCRSSYLWPNPTSPQRGYQMTNVADGGPNTGLYYILQDSTHLRMRAQVLKDMRPDGALYTVADGDTVTQACQAAGVSGSATVTTVNTTCMHAVGAFKFDSLYSFDWQHEGCHMILGAQAFDSVPDARARMESLVRQDTTSLFNGVILGDSGLVNISDAIRVATDVIEKQNPSIFSFWNRDPTNTSWLLRQIRPLGILAPGC